MRRTFIVLAVTAALIGCDAGGGSGAAPEDPKEYGKADGPIQPAVRADGGIDWDVVAKRCGPPAEDEPIVYADDFHWGYPVEEMGQRFDEMYVSGKRLEDHAYHDEATGEFHLPITKSWGGHVVLSTRLVENVRMHIEKALTRGYAEFVFFPDMGHSHFFIPTVHWESVYGEYTIPERGKMLSALFDDPELKVLYHLAEQLSMLDEEKNILPDRHVQWRFFTRNPVGDNDWGGRLDLLHEPTSKANTARDLEGHYYYGAGFNITATADGCFPYVHNGLIHYFDISMKDLPYQSLSGPDEF